jgi:hypothetical protein
MSRSFDALREMPDAEPQRPTKQPGAVLTRISDGMVALPGPRCPGMASGAPAVKASYARGTGLAWQEALEAAGLPE